MLKRKLLHRNFGCVFKNFISYTITESVVIGEENYDKLLIHGTTQTGFSKANNKMKILCLEFCYQCFLNKIKDFNEIYVGE